MMRVVCTRRPGSVLCGCVCVNLVSLSHKRVLFTFFYLKSSLWRKLKPKVMFKVLRFGGKEKASKMDVSIASLFMVSMWF